MGANVGSREGDSVGERVGDSDGESVGDSVLCRAGRRENMSAWRKKMKQEPKPNASSLTAKGTVRGWATASARASGTAAIEQRIW